MLSVCFSIQRPQCQPQRLQAPCRWSMDHTVKSHTSHSKAHRHSWYNRSEHNVMISGRLIHPMMCQTGCAIAHSNRALLLRTRSNRVAGTDVSSTRTDSRAPQIALGKPLPRQHLCLRYVGKTSGGCMEHYRNADHMCYRRSPLSG